MTSQTYQAVHLCLVGASVRAAAASAAKAGITIEAADRFADHDLCQICRATRLEDYPEQCEPFVRSSSAHWWCYTGCLENHSDLVDRIASHKPLAGISGTALRTLRNPVLWTQLVRDAQLPALDVAMRPQDLSSRVRWLRKPLRSGGGARIEWARSLGHEPLAAGVYYQQFAPGPVVAGIFVANGRRGVLLGVTRQMPGARWTGATGFRYCLSLGPRPMSEAQAEAWQKLGDCLIPSLGLHGLFGIDAVVNDGGLWPLEINPRYTASTELLEQAGSFSALAYHLDACQRGRLPQPLAFDPHTWWGKAIVYATTSVRFGSRAFDYVCDCNQRMSGDRFVDIPQLDQTISEGHPVITVITGTSSGHDTLRQLRRQAIALQQRLDRMKDDG